MLTSRSTPTVHQKIYSKLSLRGEQIRLLSIRRAYPLLVCNLRVISLSQRGENPYVALSYTWGEQPLDHTVEVNGHQLSITRSCHDALLMLAAQKRPVAWIDQICIDQSNLAERRLQVAFIQQIYHGSLTVYIWLGRTGYEEWIEPDSLAALPTRPVSGQTDLFTGRDSNPAFWSKVLAWNNVRRGGPNAARQFNLAITSDLMRHISALGRVKNFRPDLGLLRHVWAWVGLVDLLARPYFQRRWTLVEQWAAKEVCLVLGSQRFEWNDVQSAFMTLHRQMRLFIQLELPIPHFCYAFLTNMRKYFDQTYIIMSHMASLKTGSPAPLLDLLYKFKSTQTKEPLDKMFVFLSMAAEKNLPAADYTESMSSALEHYMRSLINLGQGSQVLLLAGHRREQPTYNVSTSSNSFGRSPNRSNMADTYQDSQGPIKKRMSRTDVLGLAWPLPPTGSSQSPTTECGTPLTYTKSTDEEQTSPYLSPVTSSCSGLPGLFQRITPKALLSPRNNSPVQNEKIDREIAEMNEYVIIQRDRVESSSKNQLVAQTIPLPLKKLAIVQAQPHKLPSWCPQILWEHSSPTLPLVSWFDFSNPSLLPKASGTTQPQINLNKGLGKIAVQGAVIDYINDVQPQINSHSSSTEELAAFQEFAMSHTRHSSVNSKDDHMVRDLLSQMAACEDVSPSQYSKYTPLALMLRILQIPDNKLPSRKHMRKDLVSFLEKTLIKEKSNRQLCATGQEYIGVSSFETKPGDRVALIHGVPLPMILRPTEKEPGLFEVIGDSFFVGLEHGEGLRLASYQVREIILV